MNTPELLLPAGTLDKMRTAFAFGADAVYAGQPRYSKDNGSELGWPFDVAALRRFTA